MNHREFIQHGQRFRIEGSVIRSLSTGKMKVTYGDERLRELRGDQPVVDSQIGSGRIRRLLSRIVARNRAESH